MKCGKYVIVVVIIIIGFALAGIYKRDREGIEVMIIDRINTLMKDDFKSAQLRFPHVKTAQVEKGSVIKELFKEKHLAYPPEEIFIRAFKEEKKVEVWVRSKQEESFNFFKHYDFERLSGVLGPKRKEGDLQVPEGFYYIDRYNPSSKFYLSLGVNYPNESDRMLSDKDKPGSDIFIHGGSATVGCIPIGDENIKELYLLAVEAKSRGQEKIPVHIFPFKLDDAMLNKMKARYSDDTSTIIFWENLKMGYDIFEKTKMPAEYSVDKRGKYIFK